MLTEIRKQIQSECSTMPNVSAWFFEAHLCEVARWAEFLLHRLPEAEREVVMLGVWLHDLQYIRDRVGAHEQVGATEAETILRDTRYWKSASVMSGAKLTELLNDDAIDKILKKKIVALMPMAESVNLSIKKNI